MKIYSRNQQNNALISLVGKTIKSVELEEIDHYDDGENVAQYYIIECTDGFSMVAKCESGVSFQYARLEQFTVKDHEDIKKEEGM